MHSDFIRPRGKKIAIVGPDLIVRAMVEPGPPSGAGVYIGCERIAPILAVRPATTRPRPFPRPQAIPRMGMQLPVVKVVFFDLGETLVRTTDRSWVPGALDALAVLRDAGLRLGVISNTGALSR